MSARDDYPELTVMARHGLSADDQQAECALDEIDTLRARCEQLHRTYLADLDRLRRKP